MTIIGIFHKLLIMWNYPNLNCNKLTNYTVVGSLQRWLPIPFLPIIYDHISLPHQEVEPNYSPYESGLVFVTCLASNNLVEWWSGTSELRHKSLSFHLASWRACSWGLPFTIQLPYWEKPKPHGEDTWLPSHPSESTWITAQLDLQMTKHSAGIWLQLHKRPLAIITLLSPVNLQNYDW